MSGPAEFPPDSTFIHADVWGGEGGWSWQVGHATCDRDGGSETFDDVTERSAKTRRDATLAALLQAVRLAVEYPEVTYIEITSPPHASMKVWL